MNIPPILYVLINFIIWYVVTDFYSQSPMEPTPTAIVWLIAFSDLAFNLLLHTLAVRAICNSKKYVQKSAAIVFLMVCIEVVFRWTGFGLGEPIHREIAHAMQSPWIYNYLPLLSCLVGLVLCGLVKVSRWK